LGGTRTKLRTYLIPKQPGSASISSAGQAYHRRKLAEGKPPRQALRCLKRRLSDAVYRCLLADQHLQPSLGGRRPV
jgi:hypothetical protein